MPRSASRRDAGVPRALLAVTRLVSLPRVRRHLHERRQLPGNVSIAQKLNTQIPLDLMMRDEIGQGGAAEGVLRSRRPVLLNFVYYRCPMLCPMVLEGTTDGADAS